ncbi:hypothetical protein KVV02_003723 [Mortierella alpina]|uniref:non-specific serine/threonine protein kinase n=1 Tax=Mortierella alpina TaxID=64518 RepID=A0A9P8A8M1_MORAP|nr:hypothetical protein KVV02_003723 [Mortierella alpina]
MAQRQDKRRRDQQPSRNEDAASDTTDMEANAGQLHPLQAQHQQQPWLIPHPNLPISWRNNDRAFHSHRDHDQQSSFDSTEPHGHSHPSSLRRLGSHNNQYHGNNNHSNNSLQRHRPPSPSAKASSQGTGSYWDRRTSSPEDSQLQRYRDQGQSHDSAPSDLLRPPVLYGSTPPGYLTPSSLERQGRDMYPIRRPNRSLSLSMNPDDWREGGSSSPSSARNHREIVPYSQEWRVILRSSPHGRTVLYNPQMQSLVVQTTIGPDSQPMSLRNDSRVCALCRRPLDVDSVVEDENDPTGASTFMDTNYFRMLADANIALSRRGSLQANSSSPFEMQSSSRTSTPSSSRTSVDLDRNLEDNAGNSTDQPQSPHLSHDALNQGYYGRFFVETKKLGRGYRGSVFLCQHILDGIHLGEYAIKKVAVGDNHDWLVQMLREVHLLERLHHPNIVSYKHAWLENHQLHKFGPEVTCLFILMECANGGNLEEYIERSAADLHTPAEGEAATGEGRDKETTKPISVRERLLQNRRQQQQQQQHLHHQLHDPFHQPLSGTLGGNSIPGGQERTNTMSQRHHLSITEIWSFFFDICEGLAHLHHLGIIHRDLKPPNLLLSYSNSQVKGSKGERPRILITDFGECEVLDQTAKRNRTGATGTLEFLAPELLAVDSEGRYTDEFSFKGDMWSLGMVLYYLCYSRLPYSQIEDVDILKDEIREFRSITIPADEPEDGRVIPDELKILIRVLLSTDKSKRPSCEDILTTLSHQRDRMMHGDMDSPTTPIRATSAGPTFADSELDARDVEMTNGEDVTLRD